jgi:hypothetical protein
MRNTKACTVLDLEHNVLYTCQKLDTARVCGKKELPWNTPSGTSASVSRGSYLQAIRREGDIIECSRQVNQTGGPALVSPVGFSENLDGILRF